MDAVARLKAHLGVATLRVATSGPHSAGTPIARIAVCAGAGGSLFEKVRSADLFVTGEMRHHDVLGKLGQGSSVLLSEHTHTERGFLPSFARRLEAAADGALQVLVSQVDADPLRTL
jgi:putative NIF3 family GTP cyclohydrolase 1 type 2